MSKVRFETSLTDFDGVIIEEDNPKGLPSAVHVKLRTMLAVMVAPDLLNAYDALVKPKKVLTVGDICCRALNAGIGPNTTLDVKEVFTRYELIDSIIQAEKKKEPLLIEAEQEVLIKNCLSLFHVSPWIAGQIFKILKQGTEKTNGKDTEESQGVNRSSKVTHSTRGKPQETDSAVQDHS